MAAEEEEANILIIELQLTVDRSDESKENLTGFCAFCGDSGTGHVNLASTLLSSLPSPRSLPSLRSQFAAVVVSRVFFRIANKVGESYLAVGSEARNGMESFVRIYASRTGWSGESLQARPATEPGNDENGALFSRTPCTRAHLLGIIHDGEEKEK